MELDTKETSSRTLTLEFFIGTVIFVLVIESIVWYVADGAIESFVHHILKSARDNFINQAGSGAIENVEEIQFLNQSEIRSWTELATRAVTLGFMSILSLVLISFLLVLRYWVFQPVNMILKKDNPGEQRKPELISEQHIPNHEIGVLMRSRNQLIQTIEETFSDEAITTLIEAVEAKDPYTQGHSRRVGQFSAAIGREFGLDQRMCEKLQYSGDLHDVGKIGIKDRILTKNDSLSDKEYETIKKHPAKGRQIIQFSVLDDDILEGILHHHESYDGSGYPDGLEGEDIPLFGRIMAVADATDAMMSNRPYRDPLPVDVVREELRTNRETQFDPQFAEIAIDLLNGRDSDRIPELFRTRIQGVGRS